jgi:hypothetical protein
MKFIVDGPIPRSLAKQLSKGHIYIEKDIKQWREEIGDKFIEMLLSMELLPAFIDHLKIKTTWYLNRSHSDLDTAHHQVQDAIAKALHMNDKTWAGSYELGGHTDQEYVEIDVEIVEGTYYFRARPPD